MKVDGIVPLGLSLLFAAAVNINSHASSKLSSDVKIENQVDKLFSPVDSTKTPGCALSVMKKGDIIYKQGYGMSNLEHDIPITPSSIFHISSTSKQFTVFAIALLVERGLVKWDDDIHQFIPELPDYGHRITLRHLAHNISGVKDQWSLLAMAGWRFEGDLITHKDAMGMIARQKSLNFAPGDNYSYSNSGFTLLAEVVFRKTGKTLRKFSEENIFKPLQMNATHFHDNHEMIVKNRTHAYTKLEDGSFKIGNPDYAIVGATSLFTTVEDLARWDKNLYTAQVGSTIAVPEISTKGQLNDGSRIDYARALIHGKHRGLATLEHNGGDAAYRSQYLRFPQQEFSVAVFCNTTAISPVNLARQVSEMYLEDYMAPKDDDSNTSSQGGEVTLSENELKQYAGEYLRARNDQVLSVKLKNGGLVLAGYVDQKMQPLGNNRFSLESFFGDVEVNFAQDSRTGKMTLAMQQWMTRMNATRLDPKDLVVGDLTQYVGRYYSEELDTAYTIAKGDNGGLNISYPRHPNAELASQENGRFTFGRWDFTLVFTRDTQGKVDGFSMSDERTWRVKAIKANSILSKR